MPSSRRSIRAMSTEPRATQTRTSSSSSASRARTPSGSNVSRRLVARRRLTSSLTSSARLKPHAPSWRARQRRSKQDAGRRSTAHLMTRKYERHRSLRQHFRQHPAVKRCHKVSGDIWHQLPKTVPFAGYSERLRRTPNDTKKPLKSTRHEGVPGSSPGVGFEKPRTDGVLFVSRQEIGQSVSPMCPRTE